MSKPTPKNFAMQLMLTLRSSKPLILLPISTSASFTVVSFLMVAPQTVSMPSPWLVALNKNVMTTSLAALAWSSAFLLLSSAALPLASSSTASAAKIRTTTTTTLLSDE